MSLNNDHWESHENDLEDKVQHEIRLALGARTDCVFWRNAVGLAETKSGAKIKFGLGKGTSDLVGFCRPSGRFVALEIKRAGKEKTSKQRKKEQEAFLAMVRLGGGYSAKVTSVEEAMKAVDIAIATADCWIGKTFS